MGENVVTTIKNCMLIRTVEEHERALSDLDHTSP